MKVLKIFLCRILIKKNIYPRSDKYQTRFYFIHFIFNFLIYSENYYNYHLEYLIKFDGRIKSISTNQIKYKKSS